MASNERKTARGNSTLLWKYSYVSLLFFIFLYWLKTGSSRSRPSRWHHRPQRTLPRRNKVKMASNDWKKARENSTLLWKYSYISLLFFISLYWLKTGSSRSQPSRWHHRPQRTPPRRNKVKMASNERKKARENNTLLYCSLLFLTFL